MPWLPDRSLLAVGLEQGPDRPAFVTAAKTTTYRELAVKVAAVAATFDREGLGAGHRLALVSTPSPDTFAVLLAAWERGMVVSLLSHALAEAARQYRIDEFQPHRIITSSATLEGPAVAAGAPGPWSCQPGLCMWTSGTTGAPRGAYLSVDAVRWNVNSNAVALGLRADDRTLLVLDAAYCYGLIHQVLTHLSMGATVVIPARPGWAPDVDTQIEAHQCTTLAVVPSLLQTLLLATKHLHRLRILTIGGAPSPEKLLETAHAKLPDTEIIVTYGLTEAGPRVCTRRSRPGQTLPGNVGQPFPGVTLSVSEDGELIVETPSRSTGVIAGGTLTPSQGELRTGDLATIDPDGSLRIVGRRSRAINRGGLKISPEELERVLCLDERVRAARVVGTPDRRFGEAPLAYVQPVASDRLPDIGQLASLCRRQMGNPWVPKRIEVVETLPAVSRSWKEAQP
jgi:acyl-coenzyme A synthetase/AMP-(fatty) acid ligase